LDAIVEQTVAAQAVPCAPTWPDVASHVERCFDGLALDEHEEAERRVSQLFQQLTRVEQRAVVEAIIRVVTSAPEHETQLVACALHEAADRLDPTLITIEDVEALETLSRSGVRVPPGAPHSPAGQGRIRPLSSR